jgi:hypothetical protein
MSPVSAFGDRSSTRSVDSDAYEGRMTPEMLQVERLSSCSEESEASGGDSEDRLRKVLGSERDTTWLCGEHVTPCHEHGIVA